MAPASKNHKEKLKPLSAATNMCATRRTRTMFMASCGLVSLAQHGGFFYQFADAYTTMVNSNKNNRHTHIIQPKNNRKKKVHNKRSKSSHRAAGQEVDGITKIKIKVEDEEDKDNLFPAGALSAQDLLLRERTERGEAAQEEDLAASGEFLESRNQAAPTAQLEQKLERQESIVQKLDQLSHDTHLQLHDGQERTTSRRSTGQQEETAHRIPVDDLQQVDVPGVVGEENDENTRRNQSGDDEISNENHNSRSRNSNEISSTKTFFQVSELEGKKKNKAHLHDKRNHGGPPAAVPDNAARTITAPPVDTSPSSSSPADNNKAVLYILGCIAIAVLIAAAFLVYLFFLKPEKDSSAKGGGADSYMSMTKLDMLLKEEAEVFANLENIKGIALDPQRPNKLPNPFPLLTVQETSKMIDKFLFAEHQMSTTTMRRNSMMTKNTQMNMNQNTKPIFEQDFLPMLSPAQREQPADAYDEIEEKLSYEACVAFLCGEECLLSPGGALRIAKFLELRSSSSGKNANTGRDVGGAVGTNVPGTATTGAAAAPAAPGGAEEQATNNAGTNAVIPPPGTSEGGPPPQTTSNTINPAIKLLPRPSASSLAARQSQQSQMSTTLLSTLSGGQTSTYYAVLQLANCDIETLKKDLGFPHVTQIAQRVVVNNNNTAGSSTNTVDAVIQLKSQFGFLFSDKNSIIPFRNKLRAWVYVNVKRMEKLKSQKSFVSQQQLFHQEIESLKLTPVEVEMAISMDYLHRVCGFSEFTAVKLAECYFNKNVDFQDLLPLFDNGSYAPGVIPSSVSDEEKRYPQ